MEFFFADGKPVYITKGIDTITDAKRCFKEDFKSLLQKTSEQGDKNFKYESSYLEMATSLDKYLPSSIVAKENLFKLAVFNYLFSNGDAHLKNFSVLDYLLDGFYLLSPAYDVLCSRLQINHGDFAWKYRVSMEITITKFYLFMVIMPMMIFMILE